MYDTLWDMPRELARRKVDTAQAALAVAYMTMEGQGKAAEDVRNAGQAMLNGWIGTAYPQPPRKPEPVYTLDELHARAKQREIDVFAAIDAAIAHRTTQGDATL